MKHPFVIVICMWLYYVASAVVDEDSVRTKRIIGGRKLLDIRRQDAPFKALQYVVWIGKSWNCRDNVWFWKRFVDWLPISPASFSVRGPLAFVYSICPLEKPDNLQCGGALITPQVVQTVCHCVASLEDAYRGIWGKFTILSNFEDRMIVYMGQHDVNAFQYPLHSKRFAAHKKCGRMQINPYYARYDIGWIILKDLVPEHEGVVKGLWNNLDYAGPYRWNALKAFHHKVVEQRHVCLVMGFGDTKQYVISPSRILRVGWVQIFDYINCYDILWKSRGFELEIHGVKVLPPYNESASWVCSQPLRHNKELRAQHWHGDSGSPVTCSNNYFAIVSSFSGPEFPVYSWEVQACAGCANISRETAVASTPESITVEYRRTFDEDMADGRYHDPGDLRVLRFPSGSARYPHLRKVARTLVNSNTSHLLDISFSNSPGSRMQPVLGFWILASIIINEHYH